MLLTFAEYFINISKRETKAEMISYLSKCNTGQLI